MPAVRRLGPAQRRDERGFLLRRELGLLAMVDADRDDFELLARRPFRLLQSLELAVQGEAAEVRAFEIDEVEHHGDALAEIFAELHRFAALVFEGNVMDADLRA